MVLAALASGLKIETRSPDAHCPDLAATREAAEARLGVLAVEGAAAWKAVYTIVYAPETEGNHVHLELYDPRGELKLERDLPLAGESCSTMGQVVVLVLERYFRDLGGMADASPIVPAAAAPSDAAAQKSPTADTPSPAPPQTGGDRNRYRAALTLGGAFASPPSALAIDLEGRLWIMPRLHLGLAFAWSPSRVEEQVGPAHAASMSTLPVRASLGIGKDVAPGYIYLGPEALISFDRATTEGFIEPGPATRVVLGVGAVGGALFWLRKPVALTLNASADVTLPLATSQFVVRYRGVDQEVLTQQWVQGLVAVGFSYVAFP
jgi:hypothetical protein